MSRRKPQFSRAAEICQISKSGASYSVSGDYPAGGLISGRDGRARPAQSAGSRAVGFLTCRGFGILFDRERSALNGSVVSTVGQLHHCPTAYDKSGKRRANKPVALVEFLSVPSQKTD